jgi:hypothetical protein
VLEAAIDALEDRFKNLTSSGQILDLLSSSEAKASISTLDYYMFGASGEVVSSAAVTRVQSVSRATPSIIKEFVESLRARDNGPTDQFGHARWPSSFGLADAVQTVSGCNLNVNVLDLTTTWCTFWHPKCCMYVCLQRWNGRPPASNQLRFSPSM